jgi:outer membrane protein assembly factor BamB
MTASLKEIVFTGFNKHVLALDQNTGEILWDWACPKSSGYVSLLLTDDRHLIVSVNGYTYCLDPVTGNQRWFNELSGYGTGVASLVSVSSPGSAHTLVEAAAEADAAASSSGATSAVIHG